LNPFLMDNRNLLVKHMLFLKKAAGDHYGDCNKELIYQLSF